MMFGHAYIYLLIGAPWYLFYRKEQMEPLLVIRFTNIVIHTNLPPLLRTRHTHSRSHPLLWIRTLSLTDLKAQFIGVFSTTISRTTRRDCLSYSHKVNTSGNRDFGSQWCA